MAISLAKGQRFDGELSEEVDDYLTVESPLQINVNGEAFTVTMRTPGNDVELALGLLFTEDVIESYTIPSVTINQNESTGITTASCSIEKNIRSNTRSLVSASSCGLCGKTELGELMPRDVSINPSAPLEISLLTSMFTQMQTHQKDFKKSGGCHASASFDISGNMLNCYEDIGRHNAVDKVIGDLILTKRIRQAECLLVSGRVSYEIVTKAAKASIPYLIAVSAPSSLSVDMADKLGMTLIAFCRENRATVYTHLENIRETQLAL